MRPALFAVAGVNRDAAVVFITDESEGTMHPSITNAAEQVCQSVNTMYPGWRIIYKDTQGVWDELVHENGVFKTFKPIPRCFEPSMDPQVPS